MDLSFIIPFFNGKKYIVNCVESICDQEVGNVDYEVIIINDCSTDDSIEIVYKLQEKYKNIKIINHIQNKKQGGARNTGIKNATGKYIWFVDQDDFIQHNSINYVLNLMNQNKLDILQFCFDEVDLNGIYLGTVNFGEKDIPLSGLSYLTERGLKTYPDTVWSRIYRRELILEGKFEFPENQVIFEDYAFALETMLTAKQVMVINQSFYNYRINELSTMHKSRKNYIGIYTYHTCISCGYQLIKISKSLMNKSSPLFTEIYEGGVWRVNQITKPLIKSSRKEIINFFDILQKNPVVIVELNPYFRGVNKLIVKYQNLSKFVLLVINPAIQSLLKVKKLN